MGSFAGRACTTNRFFKANSTPERLFHCWPCLRFDGSRPVRSRSGSSRVSHDHPLPHSGRLGRNNPVPVPRSPDSQPCLLGVCSSVEPLLQAAGTPGVRENLGSFFQSPLPAVVKTPTNLSFRCNPRRLSGRHRLWNSGGKQTTRSHDAMQPGSFEASPPICPAG